MRGKKGLIGAAGIAMACALVLFAGCGGDSSSGGGSGSSGDPGVGTLTITGFKAGYNDQMITGANVLGRHSDIVTSTFTCGAVTGGSAPSCDTTKNFTFKNGTLTLDVLGVTATGYGFITGKYYVSITYNEVTEVITCTFNGNKGTGSVQNTQHGA